MCGRKPGSRAVRVRQIGNLFSLMEYFVLAGQPLTVREIVAEFGWARSTVFNMLSTMVEEGYLYQPGARGAYFPTPKWMVLARQLSEVQPLPDSVHALLEELAHETGETLFLAAPDGVNAVFLDVVESSADIRFIADVGKRLPIHVTAAGRAIIAQYPPAERAALLRRIDYRQYEEGAYTSPEAVEAAVREGIERGWHVNLGLYASGVAGIAVPFPLRDRRDAIVIGGPVSRIGGEIEALGSLLRRAVDHYKE